MLAGRRVKVLHQGDAEFFTEWLQLRKVLFVLRLVLNLRLDTYIIVEEDNID